MWIEEPTIHFWAAFLQISGLDILIGCTIKQFEGIIVQITL